MGRPVEWKGAAVSYPEIQSNGVTVTRTKRLSTGLWRSYCHVFWPDKMLLDENGPFLRASARLRKLAGWQA